MEYVGFADVTQYQQEQKVNMPSAVFGKRRFTGVSGKEGLINI